MDLLGKVRVARAENFGEKPAQARKEVAVMADPMLAGLINAYKAREGSGPNQRPRVTLWLASGVVEGHIVTEKEYREMAAEALGADAEELRRNEAGLPESEGEPEYIHLYAPFMPTHPRYRPELDVPLRVRLSDVIAWLPGELEYDEIKAEDLIPPHLTQHLR